MDIFTTVYKTRIHLREQIYDANMLTQVKREISIEMNFKKSVLSEKTQEDLSSHFQPEISKAIGFEDQVAAVRQDSMLFPKDIGKKTKNPILTKRSANDMDSRILKAKEKSKKKLKKESGIKLEELKFRKNKVLITSEQLPGMLVGHLVKLGEEFVGFVCIQPFKADTRFKEGEYEVDILASCFPAGYFLKGKCGIVNDKDGQQVKVLRYNWAIIKGFSRSLRHSDQQVIVCSETQFAEILARFDTTFSALDIVEMTEASYEAKGFLPELLDPYSLDSQEEGLSTEEDKK